MSPQTSSAVYEIRVRGVLGETLLSAFPELGAVASDGDTVLSGSLADQVALHGILSQIQALGLELVAVQRVALNARSRTNSSRHLNHCHSPQRSIDADHDDTRPRR